MDKVPIPEEGPRRFQAKQAVPHTTPGTLSTRVASVSTGPRQNAPWVEEALAAIQAINGRIDQLEAHIVAMIRRIDGTVAEAATEYNFTVTPSPCPRTDMSLDRRLNTMARAHNSTVAKQGNIVLCYRPKSDVYLEPRRGGPPA